MTRPAHKDPPTPPLRPGGVTTKQADGSTTYDPGTIQRGTPEHKAELERLEKAAKKKAAEKKTAEKKEASK